MIQNMTLGKERKKVIAKEIPLPKKTHLTFAETSVSICAVQFSSKRVTQYKFTLSQGCSRHSSTVKRSLK